MSLPLVNSVSQPYVLKKLLGCNPGFLTDDHSLFPFSIAQIRLESNLPLALYVSPSFIYLALDMFAEFRNSSHILVSAVHQDRPARMESAPGSGSADRPISCHEPFPPARLFYTIFGKVAPSYV